MVAWLSQATGGEGNLRQLPPLRIWKWWRHTLFLCKIPPQFSLAPSALGSPYLKLILKWRKNCENFCLSLWCAEKYVISVSPRGFVPRYKNFCGRPCLAWCQKFSKFANFLPQSEYCCTIWLLFHINDIFWQQNRRKIHVFRQNLVWLFPGFFILMVWLFSFKTMWQPCIEETSLTGDKSLYSVSRKQAADGLS